MIFLVINMYKDIELFNRFKKGYEYALKGHKIIYKNWDDVRGIRKVLRWCVSGVSGGTSVSGVIITGSNYFINNKEHSIIDESILRSRRTRRSRLPILAICYGFQYMVCSVAKNSFIKSNKAGYMKYNKSFSVSDSGSAAAPFNIPKTKYYFSHRDYIVKVPKDFTVITPTEKKNETRLFIFYIS